jgi:hypothetical protein
MIGPELAIGVGFDPAQVPSCVTGIGRVTRPRDTDKDARIGRTEMDPKIKTSS